MIEKFTYDPLPVRVAFGQGSVRTLGAEINALDCKRGFLIASERQISVLGDLGDVIIASFTGAKMHTPVLVTNDALVEFQKSRADCIISIGGGSAIGLGKAIALRTGTKHICIPTTYAGSEMTPILGQTENDNKTTIRTLDVLPQTVIYDVDLTLSLSPLSSAASGMNAIAHAVEALYAKDRNPVVSLMAEDAVSTLFRELPTLAQNPQNLNSRRHVQQAAWLAGYCLGSVGMALHHKLCHAVGGLYNLPHAETHAVILPHVLAFNQNQAPEMLIAMQRATANKDPAMALFELNKKLGLPGSLKSLGMPADTCEDATSRALAAPYWNPRALTQPDILRLIETAYRGSPPNPLP